ncbi:hypothetical protein B5V88_09800 [Heyndrickxia sporothermodurans]|uniref:Lipoprotein n=1 Tax=Heyndrickxia sporothermodurans TaxID=46224 RepID=A0AB37H758_9BACI|nr:DUF6612 family protein [Heyndrickxia sporothermodurans]MBL5767956.1 hypothetical protein [Heyndrickxia sporothermodurans]MBL5771499.1 hypothetical protein [Heyndrickxia sporothermodurans]MBL5775249.1 hypothetical protein [Heyndrickxia sporothermodurans]MBL5778646.1 hypothetical protein [Heyndrickxia sporothermodurans]MBL5781896.1 hypothetical protein [Heyndrickxia sporothermodurans]
MKKLLISLVSVMFIFSLAACSETADPVDSKVKPQKKDSLTLKEVFEKTTDASKNLKSVHMDMDLKQEMTAPSQPTPMNINSNMSIDMVLNPLAMYQKMKMNVEGGDDATQNQAMDMESYLTKEGFFLYDPASKQWMQMPEELSKQILQMPEQQANPAEQLKQLQQFTDDFSFKQDDNQYILNLKASGEKFDQFLKENAKQMMPDGLKENVDALNNITFKNVNYEIFIDKKTFNVNSLNMTQEMEMAMEGQKINLKQEMKGTYSNYNKVNEIKVPKEVKDTAKKIN